jgi:hypothetical protein
LPPASEVVEGAGHTPTLNLHHLVPLDSEQELVPL